jgi:hypothetical protein
MSDMVTQGVLRAKCIVMVDFIEAADIEGMLLQAYGGWEDGAGDDPAVEDRGGLAGSEDSTPGTEGKGEGRRAGGRRYERGECAAGVVVVSCRPRRRRGEEGAWQKSGVLTTACAPGTYGGAVRVQAKPS